MDEVSQGQFLVTAAFAWILWQNDSGFATAEDAKWPCLIFLALFPRQGDSLCISGVAVAEVQHFIPQVFCLVCSRGQGMGIVGDDAIEENVASFLPWFLFERLRSFAPCSGFQVIPY